MAQPFTDMVIAVIKSIPCGKVMTYGTVALRAGKPGGARQVSWVLHACSQKYGLPWHRVVNRLGKISLADEGEKALQRRLLEEEGVRFDGRGRIDLQQYLHW